MSCLFILFLRSFVLVPTPYETKPLSAGESPTDAEWSVVHCKNTHLLKVICDLLETFTFSSSLSACLCLLSVSSPLSHLRQSLSLPLRRAFSVSLKSAHPALMVPLRLPETWVTLTHSDLVVSLTHCFQPAFSLATDLGEGLYKRTNSY